MENHKDFHPDELLERAVDAVLRDPIPGELPPDQLAQLTATVRRAADRPYPIRFTERIKNMRWTTRIAMAATILIALLGWIAWYVPGGGPALAFADVADALNGIRAATWKTTETMKRPQGEAKTTGVGMFMAPAHERMEHRTEHGVASITILDGEKSRMINLDPATKMATVMNVKSMPAGAPTWGRTLLDLRQTITDALSGKGEKAERLGIETVDGRPTEVFRLQYNNAEMKFSVETKIWADPKTSLPVRVERSGRGETEFHAVMTDFRVGEELDPALFSVEVPEGYRVVQTQLDFSKGPLGPLGEVLGMAAENNGGVFPARLRGDEGIDGILKRALVSGWKKHGIDVENAHQPPGNQEIAKLPKEKLEEVHRGTMEIAMKLSAALGTLGVITQRGDWHYSGKDVKRGTPNRPIFWCKFKTNYQVIYADLSVKEVSPQDVPKVSQSEGSPPK